MTITPEAAERAAAALPGDHRWEITPEGNLVLMSPANAVRSMLVMRLAAWFPQHGFNPRQVMTEVGILLSKLEEQDDPKVRLGLE